MQEFRPASVIVADTELAERFHDGDADAVRSLVERYGSAVTAVVTPAVGSDRADSVARDVFVRANGRSLPPDADFAPWLARMAEELVGPIDADLWACAMATSSIDAETRQRLRAHHLDGGAELDEDLSRHELRLRRRLAHIGDTDDVLLALGNVDSWIHADPNLADSIITAIRPGGTAADENEEDEIEGDRGVAAGATVGDRSVGRAEIDDRSTVARLLRPALFGLGGGLVVLFVAIIALSAASGTPRPPDFTAELIPTGAIVEVDGGEITVTERDAGIEIELEAVTLPRRAADTFYEGSLTLSDGRRLSTGTFFEGVDVTLWAGAPLDDVVRFEVVARDLAALDDPGDIVLKADLPPE